MGVRESERLRAIEERLTRIEGKFQLLQWMLGFLLALGLTNLGLLIHLIIRAGTEGS